MVGGHLRKGHEVAHPHEREAGHRRSYLSVAEHTQDALTAEAHVALDLGEKRSYNINASGQLSTKGFALYSLVYEWHTTKKCTPGVFNRELLDS